MFPGIAVSEMESILDIQDKSDIQITPIGSKNPKHSNKVKKEKKFYKKFCRPYLIIIKGSIILIDLLFLLCKLFLFGKNEDLIINTLKRMLEWFN